MTIQEALNDIGVPVSALPYTGRADIYVTYQLIGQSAPIYAEGREAATAVTYAVDIWTGVSYLDTLRRVKAALEAAGYIARVDMQIFEDKVGRTHVMLTATTAGAVYG